MRSGGTKVKRFSFSLQSVYNHRATRREAAEREFAEASAALSDAQKVLEEALSERDAALDAYLEVLESRTFDPQEITLRTNHIASLVEREQEKRARIKLLEQAKDIKRDALMEATRDEKAIANLRDRHRARHESAAARIEQTALDEMATISFARRVE